MPDLYLKAADEAEMNAALFNAGLAYEEDGLQPAFGVSLDIIGPITRITGYDENGDPITVEYPEWHVNVRAPSLTEAQEAAIEPFVIVPPEQPYRVWA